MSNYQIRWRIISSLFIMLVISVLLIGQQALIAQEGNPLHPTFTLLDSNDESVLVSGEPASTMNTCGSCHDTTFIEKHSFHADVGLSTFIAGDDVNGDHVWDTSPGYFGRWNSLTYRYFSPDGSDLTTAEWIQTLGLRHVGGGPAVYGLDGQPLTDSNDEWDWETSGVVEMNCFLCHTTTPNNDARTAQLQAGNFAWANSATLLGTGIVELDGEKLIWNSEAFNAEGELLNTYITIQDPTNANCGQCHGTVHTDTQVPLVLDDCNTNDWSTLTTGQVISPQRLSDSGINFKDKDELTRSWDIHAERVVGCTDCHYSLNNPIYFEGTDGAQPEHLTFDPRRIDLSEYLYRPLHQFAKGENAQGDLAPEYDNTLRRCESCHDAEVSHDWLPYTERHTSVLSCETCHIPQMYAPGRQFTDWTVLKADSSPQTDCRGVVAGSNPENPPLITGFEPVLLPRHGADGTTQLAPYNLIASWYWVYGDPERPVALDDLESAWFDNGDYHADVLTMFDANSDGQLNDSELIIDSDEKALVISTRLAALGLDNPRIQGEIQPYSINHDVTGGQWAIKECSTCHDEDSRINTPVVIANQIPGNVMPTFISNQSTALNGELEIADNGELIYTPDHRAELTNLYILGHDYVYWIDLAGALMFLGTIGIASLHGGLRYLAIRRNPPHEPKLRRVYMYSVYERQWHWLQTIVIFILIFTGLIIHKPNMFGAFSFPFMVQVHNIMAAILLINAALAAFYHFASGEIRQFLPQPRGFFSQALEQATFYLRGIFRNEEHPFEKSSQRKMNPLQQVTYLGILNVLLPLQVITGVLMWGAQHWPETTERLGGLPFLAPFHTLVAWAFATFIVMHVYLTTTGHTPLAGIKSMIVGWDDVEIHGPSGDGASAHQISNQEEEVNS